MQARLLLYVFTVLCSVILLTEPAFSGKITRRDQMSYQIKIFMCGDVMTGRGIDQILLHPVDPLIHEPFMKSAEGYVEITEDVTGPIQKPAGFSYIWGDAI
jgi:poly-gamma-glutamate synthesis protein (capsule biosynthesis protein)